MSANHLEDLLAPPDDAIVDQAVRDFADVVRHVYGGRVKGIFLFGSRARGDHTPESDADVAVVLADDGWDYWDEKTRLTDLSYDAVVSTGADVQGWPVRESEWDDPSRHRNPALVTAMRRDAQPIETLR